MNILDALILSFVEGVTEFLPISSTGHMILVSRIINIPQTEFVKNFEIIIQFGAILAVVVLYRKILLNVKIWPQILIAFIPAAIIGFLFFRVIKDSLLGNELVTVIALASGGVAFIVFELWYKNHKPSNIISKVEEISNKNAFITGLFQSISVIPGVSRAGSSILGGLLQGQDRKTAAQFSFLLAIPTVFAASSYDLIKSNLSFTTSEIFLLIIGSLVAFITAMFTVKLFIKYLSKYTFIPFGIYRIVAAVVFYLVFLR
jgi:undecaprenyl-diphosphatase